MENKPKKRDTSTYPLGEEIKNVIVYDKNILEITTEYPVLMYNNLHNPSLLYLGGDHYILVILCDDDRDLDYFNSKFSQKTWVAIVSKKIDTVSQLFRYVQESESVAQQPSLLRRAADSVFDAASNLFDAYGNAVGRMGEGSSFFPNEREPQVPATNVPNSGLPNPNESETLKKRIVFLDELCKKWNARFDFDEFPNAKLRAELKSLLLHLQDNLYKKLVLSLRIVDLIQEDMEDMTEATKTLLTFQEKFKNATPTASTVDDNSLLSVPVKRFQPLSVEYDMAPKNDKDKNDNNKRNKNNNKYKNDRDFEDETPTEHIIGGYQNTIDEEVENKELEIAKRNDKWTQFFRIAMGFVDLKFEDVYIEIPQKVKGDSLASQELYFASITPLGLSSFRNTDKELNELSRGKFNMLNLDPIKKSNLFIVAAQLCGVFIRDAQYRHGHQGTPNRFIASHDLKRINDLMEELIYLIEQESY